MKAMISRARYVSALSSSRRSPYCPPNPTPQPSLHHRHGATPQLESGAESGDDTAPINRARKASKPALKRSRYPICTLLCVYPMHTIVVFLGLAAYSSMWYVCVLVTVLPTRRQ